jgi:hypothetical protein
MSAQTDGSLIDDEVIEILRQAGSRPLPTSAPDLQTLLSKGRRARRRHRAFVAQVSSLAIVGLAIAVFAIAHIQSSNQQIFLAPAALSATASTAPAQSDPNWQVLQEALGDDFVVNSETAEISVKQGSASAAGLPDGLRLGAQIFAIQQSPMSGELATFCKPLVEKNVIFSACTTETLEDGKTVYVQDLGALAAVGRVSLSRRMACAFYLNRRTETW